MPGQAQPTRSFDSGSGAAFTHWSVEHDKEDGSGNDVCIMTAAWPGRPTSFSVRKDATKDHYALRFLDPATSFTYDVPVPVTIAFDGDMNRSWSGPASGVGPVFDFPLLTGPSFGAFEQQLLAARWIAVSGGGHFWTATLADLPRAYAMLQDCIVSVTISDGRW